MDTLFPHVHAATRRTLEANGYTVVEVKGQTCCGALHEHAGDRASAQALARENVAAFADSADYVVVNSAGCGALLKDYGHLLGTERAEQVVEVDHKIAELKRQHGISRSIWLMPILESALGIENAFAIAAASANLAAVTIGLEDYTADLGVVKTSEGTESLYARTRLVNAARAAGVQAINSVYGDVADMDGLRLWGQKSRALGFEGMGCVHPLQIAVVHQAFAPKAAEIEKAQKIVAAFEEAQQRGLGVVSLGSKMIDPPVVQRALKLVKRARDMGLVP